MTKRLSIVSIHICCNAKNSCLLLISHLSALTEMSEKGRSTSTRVPARDVRKIQKVLKQYTQSLSQKYWPRWMRDYVAETLSRSRDILPQPERDYLCSILKESTNEYIHVQQRREILSALQTIHDCLLEGAAKLEPLAKQESPDSSTWPQLNQEDDLAAGFAEPPVLCRPVQAWLFEFLKDMAGEIKSFSIEFDGTADHHPVLISVEKNVQLAEESLLQVSKKMIKEGWLDLTPSDVICFNKELLARPEWNGESGRITGGSPSKGGSVGGIVRLEDNSLAAISAFHVLRNDPCPLLMGNHLCLEHYEDIAVVALDDYHDHDVVFNFAWLEMIDDLHARPGELVYKVGRATGLTVGTLRSPDTTLYDAYSDLKLEHVVQVDWDQGRFSSPTDCGAFYCLQRQMAGRQVFVPVAVHRIDDSLNSTSYGSHFGHALDYVLGDGFEFVNSEAM